MNITPPKPKPHPSTQASLEILQSSLRGDGGGRLHAAEALIAIGHRDEARDAFRASLESTEARARMQALRIFALSTNDAAEREHYLEQLYGIFKGPDAAARRNSIESLCKLGFSTPTDEIVKMAAEGAFGLWLNEDVKTMPFIGRFRAYARWIIANSLKVKDELRFVELLDNNDPEIQGTVPYGLSYFDSIQASSLIKMKQTLLDLPENAPSRVRGNLLIGLFAHTPASELDPIRDHLLKYLEKGGTFEKNRACTALSHHSDECDLALLEQMTKDQDDDVRVLAAHAILNFYQS